MAGLPSEMSVTELATVLQISRKQLRRRVEHGTIPTHRVGPGPRSKRVVLLEDLRRQFPELYDAVVAKYLDIHDIDE